MSGHEAVVRLGPYRLESLLGRGGMGEVFLAWDERLERRVAVKRIRRGDAESTAWHERFLREARATARLNHPAIVQIYDFVVPGDDSSDSAIVLEYVEGRPLSQLLAAGPLPVGFALELAREIAGGLAAAHAAGILHRDLKAGNVLVTPAGHAKILDFGLARPAVLRDDEEPLTETGNVLGTFHAMSPEQAAGQEIDARSDLFSFGVLLYEMLAGVSPFRGANALATLRRVIHDAPAPLAEVRPELPPTLAGLVHRLLAKSRDARPAGAAEVAGELAALAPYATPARVDEAVDDLPTGPLPVAALSPADHSGSVPVSSSVGMSPARPRQIAWLAGGAVAALLAGASYFGLKPPSPPLRLAVPPPAVVQGAEGAPERLALAASGVHTALLSGLSALEGLAPLDPSQLGDAKEPREMARAAAADEVLLAALEDEGDLARLSLRRVAADGRVLWSEELRLPTAPGELQLAADAVRAYLRQAYPDHPPRPGIPDLRVAAGDYAELLAIRRQMEGGQVAVAPLLARVERLAQSSPRFLEAQLLGARLAWSLYQNTRDLAVLDRAGGFAARARAFSAGDPRPLKESFRIALERGRTEEAGELLGGIERLLPGDPEVLVLRAELAARQDRTAEALADLRAAVRRAPSWKNLFTLARLEYGNGELAAARTHFGELLARSPDNQWGLGKLAEMELMLGDPGRAQALYRRLIALAPQRAHFTNLGLALSLAGRQADAIAAYREALAIDPGHSAVRLNLADALLALGRSREAAALYGEVLADLERRAAATALEPTEEMIMAQCLAHLGRSREAVEIVQRTRERHPGHPEVVYLASLVYAVVGDRASALVNAKAALDAGTQPRWFTLPVFGELARDPELVALLAGAGPPSGKAAAR